MAANNSIVKKSIQIDAGNTVRTVKSLKQEISDLRDELLNLEQGTQEYDDVQKQLQEDVNDLNTVMSAHKDQAEVLEGSYQDLQNQLKELKAAWKSTNDEAERDVLGQKINDLNNQLKDMDASIGDFHRNVGNYESAWNGLTGVMENGEKITDDLEKGIKAFGTAIGLSEKQVNGLSDVLKRLKDGFNIAKDITKAKEETAKLSAEQTKAAATGAGLATSQKATGAAAKTMAAGEVAAAGATKGLSIAMRGLKAALISTGIGALVVLVGELIAQLDKLRLKIQNSRDAAFKQTSEIQRMFAKELELEVNNIENTDKINEHELDMAKARGEDERKILQQRKENYEQYQKDAAAILEEAKRAQEDYQKQVAQMSERQRKRNQEEIDATLQMHEEAVKRAEDAINEYWEATREAGWAIEIYDEEQKHIKATGEELKKWSDLVKDPKFQEAWSNLFKTDFEGVSPIETIKKQREAGLALVKQFKGDTSEVEQFFNQMLSEAEADFQSIKDLEDQIFNEGLTPAQRLENEKADWLKKYEEWGQDASQMVKYYNDKIAAAEKEAAEKAAADQKAIEDQRLADLNAFLAQVDDALDTQAKLDEMFNPMFIQDTARGDLDQEAEGLQRLYDAQMEYLNGLLESADLTEEAYAGVEERILQLTVTFNNQMNALKKEQDFQGKNFALLTRKQVANWNLMETAAGEFSNTFQSLGLENSVAFKGFASAQALISAILAANRVLAEEPGEMWIKIAAAAATLTAGLANVAAIWAVNPDGSNAGSSMGMSMQSATPVIGDSQPINYTRNLTTAEEEDQMNQPIYVKVTDIEDGINGRRAQIQNSSF